MLHHHPGVLGPYPGFGLAVLIVRLIFLALFLLLPLIIGLAYIWPDARRRGQPGWLWALASIFLSWFGVLAYLVVRAFTRPTTAAMPPAMYPPAAPVSPMAYPAAPMAPQPSVTPMSDELRADQPPNEQPPAL
jgi:hypothetical protein